MTFLNSFHPDLLGIPLKTSVQVDNGLQSLLLSICMLILWQFHLAIKDTVRNFSEYIISVNIYDIINKPELLLQKVAKNVLENCINPSNVSKEKQMTLDYGKCLVVLTYFFVIF